MIATRFAGLTRLEEFLPNAGSEYTINRNYDLGHHQNVSMLSPYLSCGLLSEVEVISRVLEAHAFESAEKFIQEVLWRTYWKGWLQMRPAVWEDFRRQVEQADKHSQTYRNAVEGRTGIECFDYWSEELQQTGYLHNHARMWFASIWIHTLGLPWQLGAEFFYQHLLDGDAASNTLSWKWVAGLQTEGKAYLASWSNIEKFTRGRFQSGEVSLAAKPQNVGFLRYQAQELPESRGHWDAEKYLLTIENLNPPLLGIDYLYVLGLEDYCRRSAVSPKVRKFLKQGLEDATDRIVRSCRPKEIIHCEIGDTQLQQKLTSAMPTVGFVRDSLQSLPISHVSTSWQRQLFPLAVKGYFHFKKNVFPNLEDILNSC